MTDLVLHGGVLLTQDPACPLAAALAVRDGRITAVGRDEDVLPLANAATRRVHLEGRTLVPGFIDAHAHIWKIGHLLTTMVDLRQAGSIPDIVARLQAEAVRRPEGAWVLGRGWNEARLTERRAPTRPDLDAAFPDRPGGETRGLFPRSPSTGSERGNLMEMARSPRRPPRCARGFGSPR